MSVDTICQRVGIIMGIEAQFLTESKTENNLSIGLKPDFKVYYYSV